MPLFLPIELSKRLLDEDLDINEADYRKILDYEIPAEDLYYPPTFTIRSSKPRPDGLEKNAGYDWLELVPLGVGDPD